MGQHRRRKGAKQRDRDRARAALHRASKLEAAAASATASETLHQAQLLLPPPSPLHTCQDHLPEHHQGSLHQLEEVVRHHPHPGEGDVHHPPHHATLAVQVEHVSSLSLPLHSGSPPPVQQHTPPSQHPAHEQAHHHHPRQAAAPLNTLPGQAYPLPPPAPSYSSIAITSLKSPPRPPDQPGSPGGWGAIDPTRAESGDDDYDSEEESVDTGGHSAQVGDKPHHAAPPAVNGGGPQHVPHDGEHEHVSPLPLLPPYLLHTRSPPPVQKQPTQQYRAELSSFCFLSSEPPQHPLPSSSSRRVASPRLNPRESLSEIRKPVKYLKDLLGQNIERAVMNSRGGRGGWVWDDSDSSFITYLIGNEYCK